MTAERLRFDLDDLRRGGLDSPDAFALDSSPTFVGKVVRTASTAGTWGCYVVVHAVSIFGAEIEAGAASLVESTGSETVVFALGLHIPKVGDLVVCRYCGNRWVTRIGGTTAAPTGQFLGCVCSAPPLALRMSVSSEGCSQGLFHACDIRYKTTPAELAALHLGSSCYLSDQSFIDEVTGNAFYYYLACFSAIVRISRVFPESVYGSPFLDTVIYFWSLGLPGNTCTPFLLSNGSALVGGDPNCLVTLSE